MANDDGDVPETAAEPPAEEDGWENLMDGNIRKRTLVEGNGDAPEMQQDILCDYEVRLADGPAAEVLQRRESVRYRIGEGEAPPSMELCLRHMIPGEEADVYAISRMAWPNGWSADPSRGEKDIPAEAVIIRLKLLRCLPKDVFGWEDQVGELKWRKESGNDHFKHKNYPRAAKCYQRGVEVFAGGTSWTEILLPKELGDAAEQAATEVKGLMADCHANLAAVKIEEDEMLAARAFAETALEFRPDHVKALYRRAKICLRLGDFGDCEESLRRLVALQPEDPGVRRLQADLRASRQKYASSSKKMAARVVRDASSAGDAPASCAAKASAAPTNGTESVELAASGAQAAPDTFLAKAQIAATTVAEYHLAWATAALTFAVALPDKYAPAVLVLVTVVAALWWVRWCVRAWHGRAEAKKNKQA